MPEYRLKTVSQGLKAAAYFTIREAKDAATDLANKINEAVTVVEVDAARHKQNKTAVRPKSDRGGYSLKMMGDRPQAYRYSTLSAAEKAAQVMANDTELAVTVIDMGTYPRAQSLKRTFKPSKARRVAVATETRQAPANRKRTNTKTGKAKSQQVYSKLHGMSLFSRNPTPRGNPLPGEYYFENGGRFYTSRDAHAAKIAAQRLSNQTGKRIVVYREDLEREPPMSYKAKPMRRNPVDDGYIVTSARYSFIDGDYKPVAAQRFRNKVDALAHARHMVSLVDSVAVTDASNSPVWNWSAGQGYASYNAR